MKIVSLVPSATELVFALGAGDALVGVTDECDFPDAATRLPVVSRSLLPPGLPTAGEIDQAVTERAERGEPLHAIDEDLLAQLAPDLILTQSGCRVCGIAADAVREAAARGGVAAEVVSLDPHTLDGVAASFETAGATLERSEDGASLATAFRERVRRVREQAGRLPTVRVLCLQWSDPPWIAGDWVPDMVRIAGGTNLLTEPGAPSTRATWRDIADATPEVIAFLPCGYYLEEAEVEVADLFTQPEFAATAAAREKGIFAFDASLFSRPGPRLVDGLEALAWAIHPEAFPVPPPGTVARVAR